MATLVNHPPMSAADMQHGWRVSFNSAKIVLLRREYLYKVIRSCLHRRGIEGMRKFYRYLAAIHYLVLMKICIGMSQVRNVRKRRQLCWSNRDHDTYFRNLKCFDTFFTSRTGFKILLVMVTLPRSQKQKTCNNIIDADPVWVNHFNHKVDLCEIITVIIIIKNLTWRHNC